MASQHTHTCTLFHCLIVSMCVCWMRQVAGIDSLTGNVAWRTAITLPSDSAFTLPPVLFVTRARAHDTHPPQASLVWSGAGGVDVGVGGGEPSFHVPGPATVALHFSLLTGHALGRTVVPVAVSQVFTASGTLDATHAAVLVGMSAGAGEGLVVIGDAPLPTATGVIHTGARGGGTVRGYGVGGAGSGDAHTRPLVPVWTLALPPSQHIVRLVHTDPSRFSVPVCVCVCRSANACVCVQVRWCPVRWWCWAMTPS